ncbi:MAG TPA: putative zinc-binding protein [Candidatus Deferrimicrobium sp.]|nr:putative zinc-binding protein [Candidatus Deferrimicrobium sp.]
MSQTNKKVGVTACTGINIINGTITRMAIYKVLEELKPNQTVLICLPALAAEVEEDVEFVRDYPSIILDGCEKKCAEKVFKKFKSKIKGIFNVSDYRAKYPHLEPKSIIDIGTDGEKLAQIIANDIAKKVDEVLSNA